MVTVSVTEIDGITYTVLGYPSASCDSNSCIQNGQVDTTTEPDGIALVDSNGAVVEFLSYEGSFTATGGPANGQTSVDIGVSESTDTTPAGHSLQRTGEFTWDTPRASTKGGPN
jgi:hypothetical protein